jgi:hypothetical protein
MNMNNKVTYTDSSTNKTKIFIQSTDVKVFPCAYRGYDNSTPKEIFDSESSAFTEYNFTNIYGKSKSKESFIIS